MLIIVIKSFFYSVQFLSTSFIIQTELYTMPIFSNTQYYIQKYYNTQSTMKIPKSSHKRSHKKEQDYEQQQLNSENIPSDVEPLASNSRYQQDHRTPEQVKIALAKKLIQKTKTNLNKQKKQAMSSNHDNFFIADEGVEVKKSQFSHTNGSQQMELAQQLKNEYLKSKNKLYIDKDDQFRKMVVSEPISYKGHTKCITAIEVTPQQIISVSKDKSIIVWDRETGNKNFITLGKEQKDHQAAILCMSYNPIHQMIATAGEDGKIKLWDVRSSQLIETLKGHRNVVNGIKFGINSNNLCSVSSDRTLKQWDAAQRGIIQTYYGHNGDVLDIDCINQNDFITCGNDHQNIVWKTQKQTQVIFEGHDYAIDRVRCVNQQKFISACQDGSIFIWSQKKKKPIFKHTNSHSSWIGALDCIKQSNIFASGGCDSVVKIWAVGSQLKSFQKIHEIKTKGIVTDLKINQNQIVATSCDEHRLGRWLTTRVRNQIQVFKFKLG